MKYLVAVAGLVGLLLPVPTALAQVETGTFEDGSFKDRIEVSEVLLDVLVTDRRGNVVVGLQPEDFVVIDEGKERPVTGTAFYSNRFLIDDGAPKDQIRKPAEGEVLSDRHFILFFHDTRLLGDASNRLFRRQVQAAQQAQRWIREEMLQGDWVSVLGYDVKLKVYSDFTRDREQLSTAIDRMVKGKAPGNAWASRRDDAEGPSLLQHLPEGKALRKESKNIYDGLSLVAEATRDLVGRKNLMLFSIGFGEVEAVVGNTLSAGNATARPDTRYYPDLVESLNDNNVAVYPIDLTPSEWRHAQSNFLNQLAAESGGEYHFNFTSFITPMKQVADEANGYYLLSYLAEHPSGEAGYRDVKIKTRNPELKVRARTGYRYGA